MTLDLQLGSMLIQTRGVGWSLERRSSACSQYPAEEEEKKEEEEEEEEIERRSIACSQQPPRLSPRAPPQLVVDASA